MGCCTSVQKTKFHYTLIACFDTHYNKEEINQGSQTYILGQDFKELNDDNTQLFANNNQIRLFYSYKIEVNQLYNFKFQMRNLLFTMENMFNNCKSLTEVDFTGFRSDCVKSMKCLFKGCSALLKIDLSGLNLEKIQDFSFSFCDCTSLKECFITNINITNVETYEKMFSNCTSIESLDISHFIIIENTNVKNMFENCNSLKELKYAINQEKLNSTNWPYK